MFAYHGLWAKVSQHGPGLFLWAENFELLKRVQSFKPISDFDTAGIGLKRHIPWHPYALESRDLRENWHSLYHVPFPLRPLNAYLDLLLPCEDSIPLGPNQTSQPRALLRTFRVPGLFLNPIQAATLLLQFPERTIKTPQDHSLSFWREALTLVLYALIHGTYQPTLFEENQTLKNLWQVDCHILSNQINSLKQKMPLGCLSQQTYNGIQRTRESMLKEFLNDSLDALIRTLSGPAFLKTLKAKKRKKQNPLDQFAKPFFKSMFSSQIHHSANRDVQAAFMALFNNWMKTSSGPEKPWQLCLTVLSPEIGSASLTQISADLKLWRLVFSLQNTKDRDQHFSAAEIWELRAPVELGDGKTLMEYLLRELSRTLKVCPLLERGFRQKYPCYLDLTTNEIHHFLTESAPALKSIGCEIVPPEWWDRARRPLKPSMRLHRGDWAQGGMMGMNTLVDFEWVARVDQEELSPNQFSHLIKHQLPLVPYQGHWVQLDPQDLHWAVNTFQHAPTSGQMPLGQALTLELNPTEEGAASSSVHFSGQLSDLFSEQLLTPPDIPQPAGLQGSLRPYQMKGLSWLVFLHQLGFGACLADDMGLGKTIQLLALLQWEKEHEKHRRSPSLLICPMSVVGNWYREAKKFTPQLKVMIHHGPNRDTGATFHHRIQNYDIVLTTYQLINRDQDLFFEASWQRIALDEAQNIKNSATQQTQAILKLSAKHRITLTGTPIENHLGELWSIMEFLNPGLLGNLRQFQSRFVTPIEKQKNQEKIKALKSMTQPFILRRLKSDGQIIKDLPEKNEFKVYCDLTDEQKKLYRAFVETTLQTIEQTEPGNRSAMVLTMLTKLKQICNHPAHFFKDDSPLHNRSGKMMRLAEMLEEALSEGDKSIIFTQYTEMGILLERYLSEIFEEEIPFIHGQVTREKREILVDRFQKEKQKPSIMILTVKTGGTGLNLTAANHVFHYDRWWNPAVENQATDRAFRIGQTKNVQVHKLIAIGTLEDRIDQLIDAKKELVNQVIGAGEGWLTQLNTDQLREIVKLSLEGENDL
jgi:hypothetical protein